MSKKLPTLVVVGAFFLAGCSSPSPVTVPKASVAPVVQSSPSLGLCDTITLGSKVDVTILESGCSDPDRNTVHGLNHTKCRSGSEFGTYDLKDATGKVDQLFAYKGTWHSTNKEDALYKLAFDECL